MDKKIEIEEGTMIFEVKAEYQDLDNARKWQILNDLQAWCINEKLELEKESDNV